MGGILSGSSTSSLAGPPILGVDDAFRLSLVRSAWLLALVDRLLARLETFRSGTGGSSSLSLTLRDVPSTAAREYEPFFLCVRFVGRPFGDRESCRPW